MASTIATSTGSTVQLKPVALGAAAVVGRQDHTAAASPASATALVGPAPPMIGLGGWLIGDGIDAVAGCTGTACNGGLLWGNGGAGLNGGTGGNAALLVADGLTNREIADAVSLSVRTIEGHIYRASCKAGVVGRSELTGVVKSSAAPQQSA